MHGSCRHYCVWNNGTHPIKSIRKTWPHIANVLIGEMLTLLYIFGGLQTTTGSFISVRQLAGLYLSPSLSVVIHSIDFFPALFCASLSGFWSPSRYLANISLMGHFLWISRPSTHPHPDLPPRLLAILCWLFPWLHHFWLSLVRSDFSILVGRWMKMWGEFWWSAFVFF